MSPPSKPSDRWCEWEVPFAQEESGSPFRYWVESSSGEQDHLVDLTARNGLGWCDCVDFATRANPNYVRLKEWIPFAPGREGRGDCRHLHVAKSHFYLHVTVPLLKRCAAGIQSHQPTRKNP